MGISFATRGNWAHTFSFLHRMQNNVLASQLERYGARGVAALEAATPMDSGETAKHWSYEIVSKPGYYSIRWKNDLKEGGAPVAVLIQYGHGTRNGGFVQGRDYINPTMQPIFDQIAEEAWKEVTKQ